MLTIRIRAARSGDWAQLEPLVAGICRAHGDQYGLKRQQFDAWVCADHAPMIVLVAETPEGILAGYVAGFAVHEFHSGKTNFNIENLFVAKPFRRKRIGEALMISIMRAAREKYDTNGIRISAENWNENALTLYRQLGFSEPQHGRPSTRLFKEI